MDRRKTDNLRRLKINQLVLLGIVSENNNENNLLINYFVAKNVNKNVDNNSNSNSNSNSSNNELRNGDNEIRDDTDNGYGHDEVVILFILIFLTMNHFFTSYRCTDLQMFVFKYTNFINKVCIDVWKACLLMLCSFFTVY